MSDETDPSNLPKTASKTHRLKIIRENTVFTGCTVDQDAPSSTSDSLVRTLKGTMKAWHRESWLVSTRQRRQHQFLYIHFHILMMKPLKGLMWNPLYSHCIAKLCIICCQMLKVAMHDCKAASPTRVPCFCSAQGCLSAGSLSLRPPGQIWGPVASLGSCCQAAEAPGLITPLPHSWTASSLTSLLNSICQRKGSMWDTKTKHVEETAERP